MRKITYALIPCSVLALVACSAPGTTQGKEGAAELGVAFVEAMKDGDGEAACELVDGDVRRQMAEQAVELGTQGGCAAFIPAWVESLDPAELSRLESYQVTGVQLTDSGDYADITMTYTEDGEKQEETQRAKWIQDRWLLTTFS